MTDKPQNWVYNTGGQAISLGEIADIVRTYLPDAQISFDKETGGRELSGNYLIDNTRLVSEFGMQYRPATASGCCRSSTTSARKKGFRSSPHSRRLPSCLRVSDMRAVGSDPC